MYTVFMSRKSQWKLNKTPPYPLIPPLDKEVRKGTGWGTRILNDQSTIYLHQVYNNTEKEGDFLDRKLSYKDIQTLPEKSKNYSLLLV